ncbi:DUF501 domain-containing protein [Motiliproteus sp. MSK22-1]|uniref:DUF501 domain-containing protein n=1 Tax=Motiliproteus sp. MSK22-1 TaxID=1897630 RepID=UPI0026D93943
MITTEQLQVIETQLGRTPRGLVDIGYQTDRGIPVVLQMRSLVDDQPFPTLYWLSSKDLYKAIARLETEGWVKRLEEELAEDPEFLQSYQQNHRDYVKQRWQMMAEKDRQRIETLGFSHLFERYGIGGIAQWDKVRCLHMHYAHYLCGSSDSLKNVIGERLERQFGLMQLQLTI